MRLTRIAVVLALALALCYLAVRVEAAAVELRRMDWPNDTQFQFGIYNGRDERYATAYYRILKEKNKDRTLYHIKYLGRNDKMSESAEVWLEPESLLPVRSTRKVVGRTKTLYVDCAYEPNLITVRQKYEGQPVTELKVPAQSGFYDFEALYWIIPQIEWPKDNITYLNYFNTFKFRLETAVITKEGPDRVNAKDKNYPATRYRFAIGSTQYTFWTVEQDGRQVPARIFMDDPDDRSDITFVNLGLNPKKVQGGGVTAAVAQASPPVSNAQPGFQPIPLPPSVPPPPPPPPEPPAPTPDDGEDTDDNPLVPAQPGGRFS